MELFKDKERIRKLLLPDRAKEIYEKILEMSLSKPAFIQGIDKDIVDEVIALAKEDYKVKVDIIGEFKDTIMMVHVERPSMRLPVLQGLNVDSTGRIIMNIGGLLNDSRGSD